MLVEVFTIADTSVPREMEDETIRGTKSWTGGMLGGVAETGCGTSRRMVARTLMTSFEATATACHDPGGSAMATLWPCATMPATVHVTEAVTDGGISAVKIEG